MFAKFGTYAFLGALVLTSLGGCIVAPLGEEHGGGGGREHEDRDGRDRGGEHRHDFGVMQKEHLGFYQPYATHGAAPARLSVYSPGTDRPLPQGIWG